MKIEELVGRDRKSLTKKEREYLLSCDVIKTTRFAYSEEVIEISQFEDGSYTKTVSNEANKWEGDEVTSSEDELNELLKTWKHHIEVIEY
jgi:predicted SpoU family rRNA methylase